MRSYKNPLRLLQDLKICARIDKKILTYYCSLAKEHPWVENLTSVPKREMGTLSSVSTFNHERAPMSCLQRLDVKYVRSLKILQDVPSAASSD